MKKILFFLFLLCGVQLCADPLLVVVLMVKNEASVIRETLQPFVDDGVNDFVVFDTGSTDGTQRIAADFFKQYDGINAHIVEEPFVDFATSRNRGLELVESLFPQAIFMLMPDAEWYMKNVAGLLDFCRQHKYDTVPSYFVHMRCGSLAYAVDRLIRCHVGVRFVGVVHEVLGHVTHESVPEATYFHWYACPQGREKSAQRWLRDRDLLLKSYEQNPSDARTLFYLAQTYACLGDYENAYKFYEKRTQVQGWDEENYMAMLRLGDAAANLPETDDKELCPRAVRFYIKAFSMRPKRAEPLIKISQYYLDRNEMQLSYLFAARAAEIPYPDKDVLFVDKHMYDFTRHDILGRCAWYVGRYDTGKQAVLKALEHSPDAGHLHKNLAFYPA